MLQKYLSILISESFKQTKGLGRNKQKTYFIAYMCYSTLYIGVSFSSRSCSGMIAIPAGCPALAQVFALKYHATLNACSQKEKMQIW